MIEKYAHKNKIQFEIIESTEFITVLRLGVSAVKMKSLNGLHKLTRVSPFGKGDKLHTSLCKMTVTGPKEKVSVVIKESDVRMDFFKATGPGGQHRNKTMSAVRLMHIPTNIIVTSSASRSQPDNRKYAYEQLQCKLEDMLENHNKKEIADKRYYEQQNEILAATYYFNHQMAICEKNGQKTTQLKQLLNGDMELIF